MDFLHVPLPVDELLPATGGYTPVALERDSGSNLDRVKKIAPPGPLPDSETGRRQRGDRDSPEAGRPNNSPSSGNGAQIRRKHGVPSIVGSRGNPGLLADRLVSCIRQQCEGRRGAFSHPALALHSASFSL